jgi:coenzyme F420 hydrogenase subunit beta
MSLAMEESLVDAAVLTDKVGLEPIPRTVTSPDDVVRCAASKYTAAPTIAEVNTALKADHAAIGVVATPCQALALAQMRTNSANKGDTADKIKLVIGLFCTWALDYRSLESFFSKRVRLDTIKKIDIPPPPAEVMVVENSAGTMEIPLSEIREMIPDSCSYCIDMTGEFSDVSVGVLEGEPTKNTLIVRTSLGRELVEKATSKGYLHTEAYPEEALEHLQWAAGRKKKRAVMLLDENELLSEDIDEKPSVLKMSKKVVESIVKRSS